MITNEQITEWRRLAEAATPGPWTTDGNEFAVEGRRLGKCYDQYDGVRLAIHDNAIADAAFIAAAREAIPALLAEVERLQHGNDQLRPQRHAAREDAYRLGVDEGIKLAREIRDERDRLRAELALNNLRAQSPTVEHYVDENGVIWVWRS